jgi:hypothetical protein
VLVNLWMPALAQPVDWLVCAHNAIVSVVRNTREMRGVAPDVWPFNPACADRRFLSAFFRV